MDGNDEAAKVLCESDLAPSKPAVDAMLSLSASELGGAPRSAHALGLLSSTEAPLKDLVALCTHAAFDVHVELRGKRANAGASICLRGLEVARDFSMGASLAGAAASATCVATLAPVCARALSALPEGDRAAAKRELQSVVDTLPPFHDYAEAEAYSVSLFACGAMLEPASRARLGPLGRAVVAEAEKSAKSIPANEAWMQWPLCRDGLAASQVVARAFHEPRGSAARAKVLAEGKATIDRATIPMMDLAPHEERFESARASLRTLARP